MTQKDPEPLNWKFKKGKQNRGAAIVLATS